MTGSARASIEALEERLGHRFSDPALLKRALTHASLGLASSNERLEFLGDRVLALVVADYLFANFPEEMEGGLAVRLNALVRREACAKAGTAAGLPEFLIMAASESGSGGRAKTAIVGGACEAVIAALYLDGGYEAAKQFVLRYWENEFAALTHDMRDAKTALQEWVQAQRGGSQPVYKTIGREGPDHRPLFTVEVSVPKHKPCTGQGTTKRDAEQAAARAMLREVDASS
jgi:ribonuclease III